MRTIVWIACAACVSSAQPLHRADAPSNGSWADRMEAADKHERLAETYERAGSDLRARSGPANMGCPDLVLNDQLTTGGVGRVTDWQPCWDPNEEAQVRAGYAAEAERRAAQRERRAAARLVDAEIAACRGIPEQEREHSVFAHRAEIAEVLPHREAGQVLGAWIVFKPVPGVTASWVRRDIDCARARWALHGMPLDEGANDPTLVPGARIQVVDREGHVEVLVRTDTIDAGELALARARGHEVPREQTAVR